MTYRKTILLLGALILLSGLASAQTGRWEKELSDKNWNLWLDHAAIWYNDDIYLPPVNVSTLPVNPPTCGWDKLHLNNSLITVSVPGTVEEHYWGEIGGAVQDTNGNYVGVSWWNKKFHLDENLKGKRITLFFQSVNLRAEVFVNGKLVGYDVVGNTPFEVNATDAVVFGQDNQLDVRITDPVGNFAWDDNILMRWGKNLVPAVHGFGGITGSVILRATDLVTVSDIYVQNQPDPKKVNIIVTLDNFTGSAQSGELSVIIREKGNSNSAVWNKTIPVSIPLSSNTVTVSATVPKAKLWELSVNKDSKSTHLYEAAVMFISDNKKIVDNNTQRFGFRWFDIGEKDGDKRFYLNGKRVFILAAMTRGIWPKNGMFPTSAMAKRDMNMMFDMGLNTMLMHRAIGQPGVFNYADSAGLFTYEEPGGYRMTANRKDKIDGPDDQAKKWSTEKLRRMVIRDRSFPSMIIYNLKNEETALPNDNDKKDMLMVHELDPSRIITYNSGNDNGKSGPDYYADRPSDPMELHMLPLNPSLIYGGWWDQHHWFGYSGYTDEMYRNPQFYLRGVINAPRVPLLTDSLYRLNKNKVIFFGEEGAFGTIVRLQKIKEELEHNGATGFREMEHLDWFDYYDKFLDKTGFRKAYNNVDSLTKSLGRNLHYFHARNIENVRLSNIADAYNLNGWASESTRTDLVDAYRNSTADVSIIRHYTQPLYLAVKLRNKVVPVGSIPIVDLYIINETNLKGKHTLVVTFNDAAGKQLFTDSFPVNIKGGEDFGQLLVENVKLPVIKQRGYYILKATLNSDGVKKTDGFDELYAVDINDHTSDIGSCAVLESDNTIKNFLGKSRGINVSTFSTDLRETSLIVIGNIDFTTISIATMQEIFKRVQNGTKLIVLSNADKFAQQINLILRNRPMIYNGGGIINWGGSGRLFVGYSPVLTGLPQAQGMSWEYQCFYKGSKMGDAARVAGIRLDNWGGELVVALGNQGSKEILTALTRIPVGKGSITLSTLNMLPNLENNEKSAVVAKKLFLNLLEY
jgi:beta-galactosidase